MKLYFLPMYNTARCLVWQTWTTISFAWQPCLDHRRSATLTEKWAMKNERATEKREHYTVVAYLYVRSERVRVINFSRQDEKEEDEQRPRRMVLMDDPAENATAERERERERERLTTMPLLYSPLERSFSRSDNINPCLLFLSSLVERSKHSPCVYPAQRLCSSSV